MILQMESLASSSDNNTNNHNNNRHSRSLEESKTGPVMLLPTDNQNDVKSAGDFLPVINATGSFFQENDLTRKFHQLTEYE